jgi:peptidase E
VSTPGPLALIGGGEHRPPCRATDRWLLEATGARAPRVAVVPAASVSVSQPSTAALARTWWTGLGACVTVPVPGRVPTTAVVEAVASADLIVLPGGVPERLLATLAASPIGETILRRWREGTALSGSSAAAMALFAWRLRIASPRPLGLTPGLGALDGYVAVPHFDRFVSRWATGRRFAERRRQRLRGLHVLGLDESTALVTDADGPRVLGPGSVTVGDDRGWRVFVRGRDVDLDLPTTTATVSQLDERRAPPTAAGQPLRRSSSTA